MRSMRWALPIRTVDRTYDRREARHIGVAVAAVEDHSDGGKEDGEVGIRRDSFLGAESW